MVITGANMLEKDTDRIEVDLTARKAENLPERVHFLEVKRTGNDFTLVFSCNDSYYIPFLEDCYDKDGNQYVLDFQSVQYGGVYQGAADDGIWTFTLNDYPDETVYLTSITSFSEVLDSPVQFQVK